MGERGDIQPIRTLIADDHPPLREGVAALLDAEPEIQVVGTADDGEVAIRQALELGVQVVVMDIQMPVVDGIQAAHRIKAQRPRTGIVILSNYSSSSYLHELLSDGNFGYAYLLKSAGIDQIKRTILMVAKGGLYVDPDVANQANTLPKLEILTPREKDVLAAMARGLDNHGIADELSMSTSTVGMHISNIYSKLEVDTLPDKHARVSAVLMYHGLSD